MKKNVIVAHPQQQHSYKVAGALKKEGLLNSYITTIYYKENQLLYKVLKIILRKSKNLFRMINRKYEELDSQDVIKYNEFLGLLLTVLIRIDKKRLLYFKVQNYVDKKFGKNVAKYVTYKDKHIIVMFDKKAEHCFKSLKKSGKNIVKILDMSSAADNFTHEILNDQIKKYNHFKDNFKIYEHIFDDKSLKRSIQEYKSSDFFVAASTFTKNSLIYNGIDENRIFVIPYGINVEEYKGKQNYAAEDDKVKFLFTGGIHPRKGIIDLFEAFKNTDISNYQLTLAGQIIGGSNIVDQYKNLFHYAGHLRKDEMNNLYTRCDVLIQPSLHDGFSFSILEGMASGLPVICTENTVGADIVINGYNGFVINAGDVEELSNKINFFINNPSQIEIMGKRARATAEQYTWDRYEKLYVEMINKLNYDFEN